jgi:hypothetical protein
VRGRFSIAWFESPAEGIPDREHLHSTNGTHQKRFNSAVLGAGDFLLDSRTMLSSETLSTLLHVGFQLQCPFEFHANNKLASRPNIGRISESRVVAAGKNKRGK